MVFFYPVRCKYYVMHGLSKTCNASTTCDVIACGNFWPRTVYEFYIAYSLDDQRQDDRAELLGTISPASPTGGDNKPT